MRKRASGWRSAGAFLLLLLTFATGGCDNTFAPIVEDQTDFFAVFGYLDTEADTQFVRVSPLRETLAPSVEAPEARVSTTLLATQARVVWRDSLVELDDGTRGLLFHARMRVEPGDAVRLEVRRAEDEVTRAVTQIPPRISLDPGPIAPAIFDQRLAQPVTLVGQRRPPRSLSVRYRVSASDAADTVDVTLPVFTPTRTVAGGLEVTVPLENDRFEVLRRLKIPLADSSVVLHSLGLEIELLSVEWETPETPVNIENGFGFFGSVARYVETWTLTPEDTRRLGYAPPS